MLRDALTASSAVVEGFRVVGIRVDVEYRRLRAEFIARMKDLEDDACSNSDVDCEDPAKLWPRPWWVQCIGWILSTTAMRGSSNRAKYRRLDRQLGCTQMFGFPTAATSVWSHKRAIV